MADNPNRAKYRSTWSRKKRLRERFRQLESEPDTEDESNSDVDESSDQVLDNLYPVNISVEGSNLINPIDEETDDELFGEEILDADTGVWSQIDLMNHMDSDSDDDTFSSSLLDEESLDDTLAEWMTTFRVKQNAGDALLKILKSHGHDDLPATARTLLHTPRTVEVKEVSGLQYHYFGLESNLKSILKGKTVEGNAIELSFGIDGIPLYNSSSIGFWPILCLEHCTNSVFTVALTCGSGKPTTLDFMKEFIADLTAILTNGLRVDGKNVAFSLRAIIADMPGKALIKNIVQFNGYFGCDQCEQPGQYWGRMTYPDTVFEARTNDSFRDRTQKEHHHGSTPLTDLPRNKVDMIENLPVDYMHSVCLGVMKRLLLVWLKGPVEHRLSSADIRTVNDRLLRLYDYIPSAFARKPRGLKHLKRWKATEYRQFLLYTGRLVLKNVLPEVKYRHFCDLSAAISILVSKLSTTHHDDANILLKKFVEESLQIYGHEFVVYNVHSLLHLSKSCQRLRCPLDQLSAFPFESYLYQLKLLIRSGNKPIQQIVRRLMERDLCGSKSVPRNGVNINVIGRKRPNNAYVFDGQCCEVKSIARGSVRCAVYSEQEPLYDHPFSSVAMSAFVVARSLPSIVDFNREEFRVRSIPALLVQKRENLIFIGLLHGI